MNIWCIIISNSRLKDNYFCTLTQVKNKSNTCTLRISTFTQVQRFSTLFTPGENSFRSLNYGGLIWSIEVKEEKLK